MLFAYVGASAAAARRRGNRYRMDREQMTYLVEAVRRLDSGEKQVRRVGEYATRTEAIKAAELLVDAFLLHARTPGMSAAELCRSYEASGEVPVIFNDRQGMQSSIWFDSSAYALSRIAIEQADEIDAIAGASAIESPGASTPRLPEPCPAPDNHCTSPS